MPFPTIPTELYKLGPRLLALLCLGLAQCSVSQLMLSPAYGSVPASLYHNYAITFTLIGAEYGRYLWSHRLRSILYRMIPVLALWASPLQFVLFRQSSAFGATLGPVITEAFTLLPLIFLSVSHATHIFMKIIDSTGYVRPGMTISVTNVAIFQFAYSLAPSLGHLISQNIGSSVLLTRFGLQITCSALYALLFPSKLLLLAIPALLHTAVYNIHSPLSRALISLNDTLKTHDYLIRARHESITGYISVIENTHSHFRALRCDHSLLGGTWLQMPDGVEYTSVVGEPIFAIFAMLEAVRLVEPHPPETDPRVERLPKTALVIGLGIGTTPAGLIAHGINTTVVEIDPVVYEYAKTYFQLPQNLSIVIDDAVTFVNRHTHLPPPRRPKYDFIVHDVFTGGAEPVELFTHEFLTGLYHLLDWDGTVAINYAGDLQLPIARLVINTIRSIFPTCRMFRDSAPESDDRSETADVDFINVVIFCSKNAKKSLTFRQPVEADFLGSNIRRHHLMPQYEMKESFLERGSMTGKEAHGDVLWKNRTWEMAKWQQRSAVSHWGIMRGVVPAVVWENW